MSASQDTMTHSRYISGDISQEPFATPNEAEKALQAIQLRKAPGPDGLPNIILSLDLS